VTVAPVSFDAEAARACIHCGMCLEACPTYLLTRLETESPRGRIHLMQQLAEGRATPTPSLLVHLDRCLACRACEAVCPSGVRYGELIENARFAIEPSRTRRRSLPASLVRRALLALFRDPARLEGVAGLAGLYERTGLRRLVRTTGLADRLPHGLRRLERLSPPLTRPRYQRAAAVAAPRARVALLLGCVMRVAYGDVHTAAARVLARAGVQVVDAPDQACCGALHAHAGAHDDAQALAKRNIAAFEAAGVDAIVVDAAGCGAHMKGYGHLLADDPEWHERAAAFAAKVRDVTEYLATLDTLPPARLDARVTYQEPCHLAHAQRIRAQPRTLLARIDGVELVEMAESDVCCGSAGSYNLTQPELSDALGLRKADAIAATGAQIVASANPGCMLQVTAALEARGKHVESMHVVEILDRAMATP